MFVTLRPSQKQLIIGFLTPLCDLLRPHRRMTSPTFGVVSEYFDFLAAVSRSPNRRGKVKVPQTISAIAPGVFSELEKYIEYFNFEKLPESVKEKILITRSIIISFNAPLRIEKEKLDKILHAEATRKLRDLFKKFDTIYKTKIPPDDKVSKALDLIKKSGLIDTTDKGGI